MFLETVQKAFDVQTTALTEVPNQQPLGLPVTVLEVVNEVSKDLRDVQLNANKLRQQEKVVDTVKQIELLGSTLSKDKTRKNAEEQNEILLEEAQGISWSPLVFEELESRLEDARKEMIDVAKQNSQWRSIIQTFMIVLATFSVLLVWFKLNKVAQKGML